MSRQSQAPDPPGFVGWLRSHPWLVAINLACILAGPVLVLVSFPEWGALRAVSAGLLAGAGFGFLVTCTRLVGGARD